MKEKMEKKHMIDRAANYAKYVKEVYWPHTSEAKRQELESMKENLKHHPPVRKLDEN